MFPSISNVWINKIVEFTIFYRYVLSTPTFIKHSQSFINSEIISGWSKFFSEIFHFYGEIVKLSRKMFHFLTISSFLYIDGKFSRKDKNSNFIFTVAAQGAQKSNWVWTWSNAERKHRWLHLSWFEGKSNSFIGIVPNECM